MEYCDCGEPMDQDCNGNQRCAVCDDPCPCCDDGGMDHILEQQELEDFEQADEYFNHYDYGED